MPLDPLLERLIRITYQTGFDQLHTLSLEDIRQRLKTHHNPINITDSFFETHKLDHDCELKIFRPTYEHPSTPQPAVYYIRGCGGIAPEPEEVKHYCDYLSKKLNTYVATLSFRLAPEHKFPAIINDTLMGIEWLHQHAKNLNIHPDQIAAWGESSGATAITVCCQLLKEKKSKIIQHQTLWYPMVDMINHYPSKTLYGQGYLLDVSFLNWLFDQYLNSPEEKKDVRVSPLLNPDLSGLPPTTLITAEYDPIRDEGETYARRLKAAGNQVLHRRFDGVTHGFAVYHQRLKIASTALSFACDSLKNFWSRSDGLKPLSDFG